MEYPTRGFAVSMQTQELMDDLGLILANSERRGNIWEFLPNPIHCYIGVDGFVTNYRGIAESMLDVDFSDAVKTAFQSQDGKKAVDVVDATQEAIQYIRKYVVLASLEYARARISEEGVFSNDSRDYLTEGIDDIVRHITTTNEIPAFVEGVTARYLRAVEYEYRKRLETLKEADSRHLEGIRLRGRKRRTTRFPVRLQ